MKTKVQQIALTIGVCLLTLGLAACYDQQTLTLDQVPSAVKTAIEQQSQGGVVKEIEKSSQDGKTQFTVEIVMNGKQHEVLFAEDGKIIAQGAKDEDEGDDDDRD